MPATYFISDIHIGLQSPKSEQLKLDNLERLFAIIKAEGRSLYMLGDILDYWMEFRHVIPKGFSRFLCLLSDLVSHNIEVVYVAGNHDFYLGRFFDDELGVKTIYGLHERLIDGRKFLIAHGDGLGKGGGCERVRGCGWRVIARGGGVRGACGCGWSASSCVRVRRLCVCDQSAQPSAHVTIPMCEVTGRD